MTVTARTEIRLGRVACHGEHRHRRQSGKRGLWLLLRRGCWSLQGPSRRDESSGIAPQPEQDKQGRHENLSQGKAEVCACLMQFTRLFCQCAMREANELFCAQSRHSSLFTCCEVCIFAPAIRHNPVCSRKMRREAQETLFTSTWCKPSRLLPVRRLALSCGRGR